MKPPANSSEIKAAAIAALQSIKRSTDTEVAHMDADAVLCAVLVELGYEDVVVKWKAIKKWYA